jgi:hypothetical protein
VSRVRNARDFFDEYVKIRYRYDDACQHQISAIRASYTDSGVDPAANLIDDILEAHLREYFVNCILNTLNWRMGESLLPEAPVESYARGTIRFLDYLGTETGTAHPLLVVETKHPRSKLPRKKNSKSEMNLNASAREAYPSIISAGLQGEVLTGEWNVWLTTLRDYVESVVAKQGRAPRRVAITSGRWLVVFADPSDSFLANGSQDVNRIHVFALDDEGFEQGQFIADNYGKVFELLEHQHVLGETPPLSLGEVGFHLSTEQADNAMHGLRLLYIEQPGFLVASPVIKVMPIVFLRLRNGSWLVVESGREIAIPEQAEDLPDHLELVKESAETLLREINVRLHTDLLANPIEDHFANAVDFEILRGVVEEPHRSPTFDRRTIVTGQHSHYFRLQPSVMGCPHHDWKNSNATNCAEPTLVPIIKRSTKPRSFFYSGEEHHCAHSEVSAAKSSEITPENQVRCGPRSGRLRDSFCEIWAFEKHLCCRTCVFENVCTKAQAFRLPCKLN